MDKIDFSGTIHISNKPTKTDMILVYSGDLVISGINVAKGAITVYQGKEPVCATIHYSAYTFDDSKVDLDYFKFFVKSPAFLEILKQQIKGGIKTEIKPKHLLPLEISIPDLSEQKRIVSVLSKNLKKTEELQKEIDSQKENVKLLRQNILQDAIEGKLTAGWRKSHHVIKGIPTTMQKHCLRRYRRGKATDKKQKKLQPITDEEKTFEIPEGWKWVRLGEICKSITDGDHLPPPKSAKGIPFLVISDISSGKIDFRENRFVSSEYYEQLPFEKKPVEGDILYTVTGSYGIPVFVNSLRFCVQRHIGIIKPIENVKNYMYFYLMSSICKKQADKVAWGVAVKTIPIKELRNFLLPLPPLKEQEEIVSKVETLLAKVTELENQIQERETYTKQLMQSILKNAFEEG